MITTLEQSMPEYDFAERHSRWIAADPAHVWRALTEVTLEQLTISRLLVAIRHLGATSVWHERPLLTDGPARMLDACAPWYALGGAIARPWQFTPQTQTVGSLPEFVDFAEPGWVKYLVDFHVQPSGTGVTFATVTRGKCTSRLAHRRFAPYWAVIRPGSGLIRRDLLAAVGRAASASRRLEAPS